LGLLLLGCRGQEKATQLDLGACAGSIPLPCSTQCALPACPATPPSWAQVKPILEQHCVVCHTANGSEPQRPFDTYAQIRGEWGHLLNSVYTCTMPQPSDTFDQMTPDERVLFETYFECANADADAELADGGT